MSPFIRDGDVICVSPLKEKNPRVGEVVAYIQPASEKLVVHRLVRRRGNAWLILGDNTPGAIGEWVPDANLLGRVTRIERDGKKVWLGLGPERYWIALFSRTGAFSLLLEQMSLIYRNWLQRSPK